MKWPFTRRKETAGSAPSALNPQEQLAAEVYSCLTDRLKKCHNYYGALYTPTSEAERERIEWLGKAPYEALAACLFPSQKRRFENLVNRARDNVLKRGDYPNSVVEPVKNEALAEKIAGMIIGAFIDSNCSPNIEPEQTFGLLEQTIDKLQEEAETAWRKRLEGQHYIDVRAPGK